MNRFASVTYDAVLAPDERDAAARGVLSAGAAVTSWNTAAGRTYAAVALAAGSEPTLRLPPGARYDEPSLVVLRIVPDAARRLDALAGALGGPGRPAGVLDARREDDALVVELDPARTPLALVLATIDAELETSPGRRIEPLLPLDDATLTGLASALLGEPALDVSRLIETHLEPLLGAPS